jgi:peptide/nickel transport system permease protein
MSTGKTVGIYLIRGITLLGAVSVFAFALASLSPVDPVAAYVRANPGVSPENIARMEAYWGLDMPPVQRYLNWISNLFQGNWGMSTSMRRPVIEIILTRFQASVVLMAAAWLFSGTLGFSIGCVMGACNGRLIDRVLKRVCLVMCSIPTFWIGLLLLAVFAGMLGWFPFGMSVPVGGASEDVTLLQRIHHMILPVITLGLLSFANLALITREKLVTVMESEYVLFARAQGESTRQILFRHGIRNTAIPAMTSQFLSFSELFGGSVFVENIFSYPGLGAAAAAAGLGNTDMALFLGIVLFSTLFVFVGNTAANLIAVLIDPTARERKL